MSHNGLSRCYSKVVKCEAAVQSSATETLIRSVCICACVLTHLAITCIMALAPSSWVRYMDV